MSGTFLAIASVVGAGATIYAANQASSATQSASNAAVQQQQAALQQQTTLSQPYRDLGSSGIDQYKALLGIGGTPASMQQTLQQTPGYQFAKTQGIDATKAAAGAMGMGLSGNTLRGIDQFSTGLADTTYQQAVQNAQGPVLIGQAAAAGQAANIGQAATNTGNILMNQGQTNAGIAANEAASLAKITGGAANQYATLNTLQNLNNPINPGVG
jgi:hypothetical protein